MKPLDIGLLQDRLACHFKQSELLLQALRHKSYINENRLENLHDNERMEFLGDTVLDLVIAETLMVQFPEAPEGDLSRMKASIVNEAILANIARELDLGAYLYLGRGEKVTGGQEKASLLSDTLEAVIAAVYLDQGFSEARALILRVFDASLKQLNPEEIIFDYKTDLQEETQRKFGTLPHYVTLKESGPDHLKRFEVEVFVDGEKVGGGTGKSKKSAEQQAAKEALAFLKKNG